MENINKKILNLHNKKLKAPAIQRELKSKYNIVISEYYIKKIILETLDTEASGDSVDYKIMVSSHRTSKENSALKKQTKYLKNKLAFEQELKEILTKNKKISTKSYKKKSNNSQDKVVEIVLSDIHIGLKTKSFDFSSVVKGLDKIANKVNSLNPTKIIIASLGDVIHSSSMHQRQWESCEMTDAQQVYYAIEALNNFLKNLECENIVFIGIAGNHDRIHKDKTNHDIGTSYFTYTIYMALKLMNPHISFSIPDDAYHVEKILGKNYLFEHGDYAAKFHMTDIGNHVRKREKLFNKEIFGFRMGHYHSARTLLDGRYLCNGSFVTNDQYADTNGFGDGEAPTQIIIEHTKENYLIHFFNIS